MIKISNAQATTLRTISSNGGEMDGYAGQKGFYCNSVTPLAKKGFLEYLGTTPRMDGDRQVGFLTYNRVKLTAQAIEWLANN